MWQSTGRERVPSGGFRLRQEPGNIRIWLSPRFPGFPLTILPMPFGTLADTVNG